MYNVVDVLEGTWLKSKWVWLWRVAVLYSSSSVVWDSKGLPLLPGASVSCSPSDMLATL